MVTLTENRATSSASKLTSSRASSIIGIMTNHQTDGQMNSRSVSLRQTQSSTA